MRTLDPQKLEWVLSELWWRTATAWNYMCYCGGYDRNAKQPLRQEAQTRHTQDVQRTRMQSQHWFSLQEKLHVISLLWQTEAAGSLLFQVNPKTVLCDLCFLKTNQNITICEHCLPIHIRVRLHLNSKHFHINDTDIYRGLLFYTVYGLYVFSWQRTNELDR